MKKLLLLEYIDLVNGLDHGINSLIRSMVKESADIQWQVLGAKDLIDNDLKLKPRIEFINVEFTKVCVLNYQKDHRRKIPNSLKYGFNLIRHRKGISADIVHAHRIEIGLLSLIFFRQIPLVQFVHNSSRDLHSNTGSSSFWRFLPMLHNLVSRYVYKHATKVFLFSENEFQIAKNFNNNVVKAQTWYDDLSFHPEKLNSYEKPAAGKGMHSINLAWLGRLETEKNPLLAVKVLYELRQLESSSHLHFLGYGNQQSEIQSLIQSLGLTEHVTFHGHVENSQLLPILLECNLMIHTSKYEGSPTAILEGLACGLPVVSSVEGDPDGVIVNGINGYRISEFSEKDFVQGILNSLNMSKSEITETIRHRAKSIMLPKILEQSIWEIHSRKRK